MAPADVDAHVTGDQNTIEVSWTPGTGGSTDSYLVQALDESGRALGIAVATDTQAQVTVGPPEQRPAITSVEVTALGTAGASPPATRDVTAPTAPQQLAGPNRVSTSVAVSRAHWPSASDVLIATGDNYPDALAAGPLAGSRSAPLLLTQPDNLSPEVADELERLFKSIATPRVTIVGGTAAVSARVEQQLAELATGPAVERVAGANRYETAAKVAALAGTPGGHVTVATGRNFPDALAAGAYASTGDRPPVLLADGDRLPATSLSAALTIVSGTPDPSATLLGGSSVLGDAVAEQFQSMGYTTRRAAGDNRYLTGLEALKSSLADTDDKPRPLIIASGARFPDALAAGALAQHLGGLVLLTPPEGLPAPSLQALEANANRFDRVIGVGGTSVLAPSVLQDALDAVS